MRKRQTPADLKLPCSSPKPQGSRNVNNGVRHFLKNPHYVASAIRAASLGHQEKGKMFVKNGSRNCVWLQKKNNLVRVFDLRVRSCKLDKLPFLKRETFEIDTDILVPISSS